MFFPIEVECQFALNVKFPSTSMTEANLQIGTSAQTVRTLLVLCKAKQSPVEGKVGKPKASQGSSGSKAASP